MRSRPPATGGPLPACPPPPRPERARPLPHASPGGSVRADHVHRAPAAITGRPISPATPTDGARPVADTAERPGPQVPGQHHIELSRIDRHHGAEGDPPDQPEHRGERPVSVSYTHLTLPTKR